MAFVARIERFFRSENLNYTSPFDCSTRKEDASYLVRLSLSLSRAGSRRSSLDDKTKFKERTLVDRE